MAHHTYKTKALVLDTYGIGEEHLFATLLTEELGLLRAHVRSARSLRSRLRYHTQPMSFGEYSLVRGRELWRLTGARAEWNAFYAFRSQAAVVSFIGRYTALLRRLLAGESEHKELFTLVSNVFAYLQKESPEGEVLESLEYISVLRTLLLLGYIGEHRAFHEALEPSPITTDMLLGVSPLRREMAHEINKALRESHL